MEDDDKLLAQAIRLILARVGMEKLWADDGPTAEARQAYGEIRHRGDSPSDLLLRVAFEFWYRNRRGHHGGDVDPVTLLSLMNQLVHEDLEAVLDLARAISKRDIATWIVDERIIRRVSASR